MVKHTTQEAILILVIGVILFLGGAFYDNIVAGIAGTLIMGYFIGCETKE